MDWAQEIINELDGKKAIPANILALIKPSVALLDLGLPPDVLYKHYQWSIRDLLRRIHPDARKGEILAALQTLSDAFDIVKDKDIFVEALAAARNDRSYERLGERALRGRIQDLQDDIANLKVQFQRQETTHQEEIARITIQCQAEMQSLKDVVARREEFFHAQESKIRFGEWFRSYMAGQMMGFSSQSGKIRPIGYMQLAVVSFSFSFSPAPVEEQREEMYARYHDSLRDVKGRTRAMDKEKSESLRNFIARHNLAAVPVSELFIRARESAFVAPALRWSFRQARQEFDLTRMGGKNPGEVVQEGALEWWTETMSEKYCEALTHLSQGLDGLYVNQAAVIPQRIIIEDQVFNGDAVSRARLFVLGTTDPAAALAHHQFSSSWERSPRLQVTDEIFPEIEPFICPGRAIVGLSGTEPFTLIPIFPDTEWARLMDRRKQVTQNKNTVFLSHIILDVE